MEITINELRQMKHKEGMILQGCGGDIQEWVIGINELLTQYLEQLKQIDLMLYKEEVEKFERAVKIFTQVNSEEELNKLLLEKFEELGIKKPWNGDFDTHMSNKQGKLVFE